MWIKHQEKVRSILSTSETQYTLNKLEYIQHRRKSLREHKNKTRSNRTGSLTSSCSNVFLWKHISRAGTADTHKRSISNWFYLVLMDNCNKIGNEIEKVEEWFFFFYIFSNNIFQYKISSCFLFELFHYRYERDKYWFPKMLHQLTNHNSIIRGRLDLNHDLQHSRLKVSKIT